jgi:hypothetical protein
MSVTETRDLLLWCAIINYAVLLVWFAAFVAAHDAMLRLHTRWFRVSAEQFDTVHYRGMAVYKVAILLLNLVPYLALRVIQ